MSATTLTLEQQVQALVVASSVPTDFWILGDDKCDCTFQRIGFWTNPYLARTLEVRMCCIWAELYKQFPQYVREIPAAYDTNRHVYDPEPRPWDSEELPMPRSYWYRQLAAQTGRSLAEIREAYAERLDECPGPVPPGSVPKDVPTAEEMRYALEQRLRHATWDVNVRIVEGE